MNSNRFSSVYDHVKEQLITLGDRQSVFVLDELGKYADSSGCCFPTVPQLSDGTKYSADTVQASLLRLEALEIIRVDVVYNERRQKPMIDYQINPTAMYIKDDHQARAWRLWNAPKPPNSISAGLDSTLQKTTSVTKESNNTNNYIKQPQQQTPEPPPPPNRPLTLLKRESADNAQREPENAENEEKPAQSAKTAPAGQETASANSNTPPSSAAPPEPDELAATILTIKRAAPSLAEIRAKELVEFYGVAKVLATLKHLELQKSVRNPAGLLIDYLKKDLVKVVEPEPVPEVDYETQERLAAQFAASRKPYVPVNPNQHLIDKMQPEEKAEWERKWRDAHAKR